MTEKISSAHHFDANAPEAATKEPEKDTSEDRLRVAETPLIPPGSLALMTFMAGPHISIVPAYNILKRLQCSASLKIPIIIAAIAFPVLYAFLLFWQIKWIWVSLVLIATHLTCTVVYYLLFRKLYLKHPTEYRTSLSSSRIQKKRYVLAGMAGGLWLTPLLGAPFAILFLLGCDKFLLTLMPLVFDDYTSLSLLGLSILGLLGAGFIAGGWAGRIRLELTPLNTMCNGLGLVWISLFYFLFLIVTVVLPGFLSSQTNYYQMILPLTHFVVGYLLIGSWWCPYLLMYVLRPLKYKEQALRSLFVPGICLSSAFLFALACGYPSSWFHSAGKFFEKEGKNSASLWCYEQGLSKNPTSIHAGYLQFRIALLTHKLGDTQKAMQSFRKIVSMYNDNSELVYKSNQLLDNLERNGDRGRRVVLPGIENPTAYKGAYCVPNSLALVMNFWGAGINADTIGREITSLASGTMTVDQAWFAEQEGFRHQFMPMANLADIKATIDAGFPVMVYVPQHVFVIVGYDEKLETLVTYDVATRDVWVEYLQKDFLKSWKKENTTMIVAYPKEQEEHLPASIQTSLAQKSDSYFRHHLYKIESSAKYSSLDHLKFAADNSTTYFFPLITLYKEYPSLRHSVTDKYDIDRISDSILNYFGRDFDEGTHLAGQFHDDYADSDEDLKDSISFFIGTGQLSEITELVEKIQSNGVVSDETLESLAMVNLAMGDFDRAILQLEEQSDSQLHFYLAQSYLEQGKTRSAVSGLVKTIDDCT